ncbi:MAG: sigma-54-dependent Fis family transcriptional regulator [Sulfuriflexus sp.]|nr:sigma-54-dependent Fis family transcriptional regulator [Sulfuriflexus sp.]
MGAEARKIIYCKPSCERNIIPLCDLDGSWDIDIAYDQQNAMDLLDKYEYKVGVAHLGCTDDYQVEKLQVNNHATEWVALIEKDENSHDVQYRNAILNGFYDYHTLPVNTEKLLTTLGHAYGMADLKENSCDHPDNFSTDEPEMVGTSDVMKNLFTNIRKVSTVDAPILITGESGTGKELAAIAIHERSSRKNGPFIAVNCGSLPDNLIQSELFGYEKGAFTGAYKQKIGRIEAATGGTVFLDEIGDLPLEQQINLLRFLQEKTIDRVGGNDSHYVDVRVIAATHVDLEKAVQDGKFREDLYYRLNVLSIIIPPLREREDDIEVLAKFMFNKFINEKSYTVKGFSQEALHLMNEYHWSGNVREMINKIRRAMLMCEGRLITGTDLGLDKRSGTRQMITLAEARRSAESEAILSCLRRTRNNITHAARTLGVSRITLYRLMDKYAITH